MKPIRFYTSQLLFFLRGEFSFEREFVNIKYPNTILGIIPLGKSYDTLPVNQIASVRSCFSMKFLQFLLGVFFVVYGIVAAPDSNGASILLSIIGLGVILTSFEVYLSIGLTSSQVKTFSFWVIDKRKADKAVENIRYLIAYRMNYTNNRLQTDRIINTLMSQR